MSGSLAMDGLDRFWPVLESVVWGKQGFKGNAHWQ